MQDSRIITIDGPAGCGKSTAVRLLADRLGAIAFSSGTVYRTVACLVLRSTSGPKIEQLSDERRRNLALGVIGDHRIEIHESDASGPREFRVTVDGIDLGDELHTSIVTREVHWFADDAEVRAALLPLQRSIRASVPIVTEGRDMGSVVFPDAAAKVFLTASLSARAERRHRELLGRGEDVSLEEVEADVAARDRFDRNRVVAPLIEPTGAVVIDSTDLTPAQVVERILECVPPEWSETCA
ncbi:MAG: (d)CMP kinase [Planctomycetes bacterium]|nr:(d)CMP kinase [Planctomycetota bacterium]